MKKIFFLVILLLYQIGFSQQITHVEYWFGDNFANRLPPQPISTNSNNETDFSISFLDNGINEITETFFCRFLDSAGNWSCIYSQQMLNNSSSNNNLLEVEYWFDDNFTSRELISLNQFLNSGGLLDHQEANIPLPTTIPQIVYYRFKGKYNQWSAIQSTDLDNTIYQNNSIDTVEYWFDDNFASKTTEQVVANANNEISWDIPWVANTQTVQYRFKTKFNQWSAIQSSNIDDIENRNNKLVEAEYWLNSDFASRETIPATQNGSFYYDSRNFTMNPAIQNTVNVRYKDNMNRWSSIYSFYPGLPGITVLVHGFQLFGEQVSPTEDFEAMGVDIINRAGGGALYKNNSLTGQLELLNNGNYTFNPTQEIVLVYDWGDLSNNNTGNFDFGGNGYLESASDNLFATIIKLKDLPFYADFTFENFINKPKHFIAHSRGNIVTLQLLHRLKTYFPDVLVDQFTLLDPHPATAFGDMNSNQSQSPQNLPCVNGVATNCNLNLGCNTVGVDAFLNVPENVVRADNYYRTDGGYEANLYDFFAFDGLQVPSLGNFNRKINNDVLNSGSPIAGGAHSGVHKWYRGTINTDLTIANNSGGYWFPILGILVYIPISTTSQQNTNNWYINGSYNMSNDFLQTESRFTTGFSHSRIGGGIQIPPLLPSEKISLTLMNQQLAIRYGLSLIDYPNGVPPHSVNGGYFNNSNFAGWEKNGGSSTNTTIIGGTAKIDHTSILKHSLMYFGNLNFDFKYLKFNAQKFYTTNLQGNLKIEFFNSNGDLIESQSIVLENNITYNDWKTIFVKIPDQLRATTQNPNGQVGTFSVSKTENDGNNILLDEFSLTSCIPISPNLLVTMPDPQTLLYTDVQNDDWFKEGVYKSRNYGLFRGTSFTTFSPDNNLTKAQAVTVLVRAGIKLGLISSYNTENTAYTDVDACNQYFPYVQTAKNLGYLDTGTTFNPEANITVAELCEYMDKILQINQHDWNAPTNPWVIAPTSAYVFNQMSQIVVNQADPIKQNAMRRILNCIDVVKNDNIIDSYRTQNVWTLHNVENNTLSNGQPINVDGSATVTRARMAVAAANMFRFIYKKLNSGNAPAGKMANTTNTVTLDPSIDDFIGIGNTFDNKDIPATETPEAPTQITFNINSGDTLGLQYQSDTDTNGNPQFFYWSMNKNVDGLIANLASIPLNSIQNHRKVNFVAPTVTTAKTWYLYSYLANNKGKIKETVITINVSPSLGIDVLNGTIDLVKVYPNPVNDILNIEASNAEIQKIELYDLQGKLILAEKVKTDKYKLNIAHLQSATYQLKLYTDKGIQSLKVVKN